MKITFHQIEVNAPYATPLFVGLDKRELLKEIADVCRADWGNRADWVVGGENVENAPPLPESVDDVLEVYFDMATVEAMEPWEADPDYFLLMREFVIDLAPPESEDIEIGVDAGLCSVRRLPEYGSALTGNIFSGGGLANEALERFCLSLTAAGFPVHLPRFRTCLQDTCEALADSVGDFDTDEDVEREIAERDFLLQYDPVEEDWMISYFDSTCSVVPWTEAYRERFKTRREGVTWLREYFNSAKGD
jgi:hypothetical protein